MTFSPRFPVRFSAFVVFMCLMLSAWLVVAAQKRCPVCHEVFDDHIHVCPNDGTDLKLLGEKIPGADVSDQPEKKASDTSNANEAKTVKVPDKTTGDTSVADQDGEQKYIRHDRGGRRRRVDKTNDSDGDYRTDRLRRIHDNRAGAVAARKKEEETSPEFDAQKDAALRDRFRSMHDGAKQPALHAPEKIIVKSTPEYEREKALWEQAAPVMSIGGRLSWMGEATRPGPVMGAEIDLNLLRSNIRVGLSSFIGVRHVSRNELIFLESVSIGVQRPWRFSPYLIGRFGIGTIVGQRFGADITNLMRGLGFDAGVDCHVSEAFTVTPAVGYVRYGVRDATWDSVVIKIALGF